ncbi:MAG: ATP-dependent ligase [Homoserinimonas sp.]|jgi:hypothetical protein|nr:ATP-dependent ligase [Homoserinimonas sp.]
MGKLLYSDAGIEIEIEDRALTHLQVVIGMKLRRGESFFFSWKDDPAIGDGRSSIWIDSAIPLYFKYFGSKSPNINREWVEMLAASANSGRGLVFTDEPNAAPSVAPRGHI